MKPTKEQFVKAKNNQVKVLNYKKCLGRGKIWSKIVQPMYMSRKRFIKLLMAADHQRDEAQAIADSVRKNCGCYYDFYVRNVPAILWDIQYRNGEYGRLYQAIFERDMPRELREKIKPKEEAAAKERAKKAKAEYKELCELMEKYPDIVDQESCREVMHKTILERTVPSGEFDEEGSERLDPKEGMAEELNTMMNEISTIGTFLYYLNY